MKNISCGIYKIVNKENQKIYIGQSVDIEKRWRGHIYDATHNPLTEIDKDIGLFGENTFDFSIIELCSYQHLNEQEKYWIKYYNTFLGYGYNHTEGGHSLVGEYHPKARLTKKEVEIIREMYNQHIKFKEILRLFPQYTKSCLKKIWQNETWKHIRQDVYTEENKKWHKTKGKGHNEDQIGKSSLQKVFSQEEIEKIVKDYKENNLTFSQLSKKYNRDIGVIQKYISHPTKINKIEYHGKKVQNVETGIIFTSILQASKWAKCGSTTISRHLYDGKSAGTVPFTEEHAHWKII